MDSPLPNMSIPFVIFATQRTGSNWLMGTLDTHPGIAAYDEMLLADASSDDQWGRDDLEPFAPYYARHHKNDNLLSRLWWSLRYLNCLYSSQPAAEAVGMKLMYDQLWRNPWVWFYLLRHRVRMVHLTRSNLLDIVLSLEAAKVRQQPHALEGDHIATPLVTLDPHTLVSELETLEFRIAFARRLLGLLPVASTEVVYEQVVTNPKLIGNVLDFLGVARQMALSSSTSRFKKLNTASQSDLVVNYQEVERALRPTRFAHFLKA
jgi:LPS sulfotransferase NodH